MCDTRITSPRFPSRTGPRSCFPAATWGFATAAIEQSHTHIIYNDMLMQKKSGCRKSASCDSLLRNAHIPTDLLLRKRLTAVMHWNICMSEIHFPLRKPISSISLRIYSLRHTSMYIPERFLKAFMRLCSSRINRDQFFLSIHIPPLKPRHNSCSSPLDRCTLYLGFSDIFIKHLSMLID